MVDRGRVSRVVVAGLCSGAHASFHAGRSLEGIDGIIVINPIVFYWNPECALDVSSWMNYSESRRYSQSVREVDAWKRLVRGEVNVRYAAGVGYRRLREVAGGAATALWRRFGARSTEDQGDDLAGDLRRIGARGVDVLLVFSEGDPGLDFVRRLHAHDIKELERDEPNFEMRVVQNADHTFTRRDARARLTRVLTDHLLLRHSGR
jgi:dienelactone hydrolase